MPTLEEEFPEVAEFLMQVANNTEPHGINGCVIQDNQMFVKTKYRKWHNIDHHHPVGERAAKTCRNDPCICGSGKKFKKCCLR